MQQYDVVCNSMIVVCNSMIVVYNSMQGGVCKGVVFSVQDIDTSLVKLLAEDRSPSLIQYITNHDLYLAFEETREALEKYSVSARG